MEKERKWGRHVFSGEEMKWSIIALPSVSVVFVALI